MSKTFLRDVSSIAELRKAWHRISSGKLHKSGLRTDADGTSLFNFGAALDSELFRLSYVLRSGKYTFSPLDPFFLPKGNGKFRVICVPTVADRVVQRSILSVLSAKQQWMTNPISYGFVSGGGVEKAAHKAVQHRQARPWVFKTDITKFFDHVDRHLLKEQVLKHVKQKSLHSLLFRAIECEIKPRHTSHVDRLKKLDIVEGRGVRQGMPLSPFFANLFLADFDKACVKSGRRVLRYADDLICFATSEAEARDHEAFCLNELATIKLLIPALGTDSKSQIYDPTTPAEFLGVEIAPKAAAGYEIRIANAQMSSIKNVLYQLGSIRELRKMDLDITKFGNSLSSRIAAYEAAYSFCANSGDLSQRLADWSNAIREGVAKDLGLDPLKLSSDARWFLGLK